MTRTINLKWLAIIIILVMVLPSCQKENRQSPETDPTSSSLKLSAGECDVITQLIAGQYTDVGEVIVTHDEMNIYVTYLISEPGWCLQETHMHIASDISGIPQTKAGNPKVGHFAFSGTHDCITEYTYTVPIIWPAGSEVVVAAHAVVGGDDHPTETAWGQGVPFPGNNWAMYFYYNICFEGGGGIGTESEIAYGYAPEGSGIASDCFLTLGIANEWGFHNGPFTENYTFELWALPNTCSHANGFHVGYVEVQFKGGSKVDVSYRTFLGYSLQEAHLWISDEPWVAPPMVDPDDFPYKGYDLGGAMIHTFYNLPQRGQVYMIAYAKVYGVIHIG